MRTIKFRGKRVDNGEWVYGYYARNKPMKDRENEEHYIGTFQHIDSWEWNAEADYVIPETVGQFTGLKDKNGVEIYEGDDTDYGYVHYHNGTFYAGNIFSTLYDVNSVLEITGNIHDNV